MVLDASLTSPEFRAGGTDLSERRRSGVSCGPVLDIDPAAAPSGFQAEPGGSLRIGARTSVAALAHDRAIARDYPGLAAAAGGLATPQIRRVATLGGAIAQRNRCWYFRNPDIACLKKGGEGCPAREGNALYAVAFDTAPCVAPHPSTLAAALLAYEARLDTNRRRGLPIGDALGDGKATSAETALAPGELITAIVLPAPIPGERAAYKRVIGRAHSEWPLVELVVSATFDAGVFTRLRLVAGGVAPVPLRLIRAEEVAFGKPATAATFASVASMSIEGGNPLPQSRYKLDLLHALLRDLLNAIAPQN
jgi:xanthine dehydrogenase YagS FAD-binding subunit